jgi:C4-dicarboxylate-specific signal transduction histidine kinase
MQVIDQTIASGGAYAMEYRRIFSGNRVRWIAGSGTAERDPTSGSTLLRGVSVDVTESYESKESLRQQREQLSHTLRLATMNQMAASLAHELNQPLAAIVNNANAGRRMMDHGVFSQKEIVSILEDIVADGQRAGGVIRGIRAMARPDDQESTEFALGDVIDTLLPLIMVEARARNIEVKTEVEPALPRLWGNPVQVQQILINLAINALEASDSPSVGTRRVIIQAKAENKDGVFINVRDFGLGLPTESEDRLFEAFFTTKPAGLGMGLAIVKSLVEAHGGSVDATNAAGGGACFQVHLPIRPPP